MITGDVELLSLKVKLKFASYCLIARSTLGILAHFTIFYPGAKS